MQNLADVRAWCENNKGTCVGLICVSILLILTVSSGKSCDYSAATSESSLEIQNMIYIDDDGSSENNQEKLYRGFLDVVPLKRYRLKFEVLLNDLGGPNEKVSKIEFNGISLGECNPKCEGMTQNECDYACIMYDCSSELDNTIVTSGTATMTFEIEYEGISKDCDCNKVTGECKKEDVDRNLTPILAAARVTLTPMS